MEIFFAVVILGIGIFAVIKGGDLLVNFSFAISKITGMSEVLVGATFVSCATVMPELLVTVLGSTTGASGLVVGNALGSVFCDMALILGLVMLVRPFQTSKKESIPKLIFFGIGFVCLICFALNQNIELYESIILLLVAVAYFGYNIWDALAQSKQDKNITVEDIQESKIDPISIEELDDTAAKSIQRANNKKILAKALVELLFGAALVGLGAQVLVDYGQALALFIGVSEEIVGVTILAVGTSLPELVTAMVSIKRKSPGLALGNMLGASIIDMTLLIAVGGFISGGLAIGREVVVVLIPLIGILLPILAIPMILKNRVYKWQGWIYVALYVAYIAFLFFNIYYKII